MKIEHCKYKIVCDSREVKWDHIKTKFEEGLEFKPSHHDMYRNKKETYGDPIQYYVQEKGLKTGDYTICVQLPNKKQINFQDKVVVERKKDLNELCCNFFDTKSKDEEGMTRIEREFKRAYDQGIKVHLVIEQTDMYSKALSSKHFRYDKASRVTPRSFLAMLHALCSRYDISVWYTDKKDSARLIHDLLYYHAREYLKGIE